MWDTATWNEVAVLTRPGTHFGRHLAFSPGGGLLASSGGWDKTVRVWDTATWNEVAALTRPGAHWAYHLAFSPDGGKLAAVMEFGTIHLWDVYSEEVVEQYSHPGSVHSFVFSPDGRTLFTAVTGARIEVWDTSPHTGPGSRIPDWDADGEVGFGDFVKFAEKYGYPRGQTGYDPRYDLDTDGEVGFADFLILARAFGQGATGS